MAITLTYSTGRLLGRNEKLTSAKINAIVKGITISLSGAVSTADLADGAVTAAKATPGAYWYAAATLSGAAYSATYTPAVTGYTDGLELAFKVGSANAGSDTLDAGAGAKPLRANGVALAAADIASGTIVIVRYNSTLVGGGCWEILSALPVTAARVKDGTLTLAKLTDAARIAQSPVVSGARNLVVAYATASTVTVAADEVTLKTAAHLPLTVHGVSLTVDISAGVALNGLETGGTETASHWYHIWLISDGTTVKGVLEDAGATGGSAPTAPDLSGGAFTGYTYMAYVGSVRNDGSSNFVTFYQVDRKVWVNETAIFASKAGATSYTAVSGADLTAIQGLVPPNARTLTGSMGLNGSGGAGTSRLMQLAGNSSGLGAVQAAGLFNTADQVLAGFEVPLVTAQTPYYKMGSTGAYYGLYVSGYTI